MKTGCRVAFRTKAGRLTGLGHLRRCLALAKGLRNLGADCLFLFEGDQAAFQLIGKAGFESKAINPGNDIADTIQWCNTFQVHALIMDSYELSESYLAEISKCHWNAILLDDLADRRVPVDLVVNGTAGADDLSYQGESKTQYLLGCKYILLNPEFESLPGRQVNEKVERILITVGGGDPHDLTQRLIRWVSGTIERGIVDIIVGPLFENVESLWKVSNLGKIQTVLHQDVQNLHRLMLKADLAVTGGGQTTYELAATGTPTVGIRMAANQTLNLEGLSRMETLIWTGDVNDQDLESKVVQSIGLLVKDHEKRMVLSENGQTVVDGRGAERVAKYICDFCH